MKNKILMILSMTIFSFVLGKKVEANQGQVVLEEVYPVQEVLFVQGLEVDEQDQLWMGTGLYGQSQLGQVELEEEQLKEVIELEASDFGEGITLVGEEIWQLTWKEGKVFVWDKETYQLLTTYPLKREGWGLAYDPDRAIFWLSDGSDQLFQYSLDTFKEIKSVPVTLKGKSIAKLNELEYVGGAIYANIWYDNRIVKIDSHTGQVTQVFDLEPVLEGLQLEPDQRQQMDALNGIAHIEDDLFYITGKNYPVIMKVRLQEPQ